MDMEAQVDELLDNVRNNNSASKVDQGKSEGATGATPRSNPRETSAGLNPGSAESGKLSDYDHPTSKIWAVYNSETAPVDKALVESWTKDMEGILIFSGLFSAVVSAFLADSYKNLTPDSGDIAVALLAQISLQLSAASNGSHIGSLGPPTDFHPANSTISVNILWFVSLILALICALSAALVQQWARKYQQDIERRPAPHKKALIRSFLFEGTEIFKMTAVVNGIPALLHVAVVLFILGLIQFLFSLNLIVAGVILGVFLLFALIYLCATILPLIWLQCPYDTPFSTPLRHLMAPGVVLAYYVLTKIRGLLPHGSAIKRWTGSRADELLRIPPFVDTTWAAYRERHAMALGEANKHRIAKSLRWTIDSLTTDSELELFVAGLPDFLTLSSDTAHFRLVPDIMIVLAVDYRIFLPGRIAKLFKTCIHPTMLSEAAQYRRAANCLQALSAIYHGAKENQTLLFKFCINLQSADLFPTLATLPAYMSPAIVSSAQAFTHELATGIETTLAKGGIDRLFVGAMEVVLRVLYDADRFHSLLRLMKADKSAWMWYWQAALRDHLVEYSQMSGAASADKRRYMEEILKHYSQVTSIWNPAVGFEFAQLIGPLVDIRNGKQHSIAHLANCASTQWAARGQSNLVFDYRLGSPDLSQKSNVQYLIEALTTFCVLQGVEHGIVIGSIVKEVTLGIRVEHVAEDWKSLIEQWLALRSTPLGQLDASTSPEEQWRLDHSVTMDVDVGRGVRSVALGYLGRIMLSRGRTAILTAFLYSMIRVPPPVETIQITRETVQLITKNLTARYSGSSTQILLVQLVERISRLLLAHLVHQEQPISDSKNAEVNRQAQDDTAGVVLTELLPDTTNLDSVHGNIPIEHKHSWTVKVEVPIKHAEDTLLLVSSLLDVMSTIAHPDAIKNARQVVSAMAADFLLVQQDATKTLAKLNAKVPFAFHDCSGTQDEPCTHWYDYLNYSGTM